MSEKISSIIGGRKQAGTLDCGKIAGLTYVTRRWFKDPVIVHIVSFVIVDLLTAKL